MASSHRYKEITQRSVNIIRQHTLKQNLSQSRRCRPVRRTRCTHEGVLKVWISSWRDWI